MTLMIGLHNNCAMVSVQGDIGREMYIVNQGLLEVLGAREGGQILAQLGPGSTFGEIRSACRREAVHI